MEDMMINMVEETANTDEATTFKRDYAPHRRASIRICVDCGRAYVLSDSDTKHYIEKFGSIPLRCEKCREKKYESETGKVVSESNN